VDTDGMPGLFDGYQMIGEEGDNQSYAKQKKGQKQLEAGPPSTSKSDGFMYESLPGVLNEDQEANMTREQVLEHEVLSDADPRLFNMGQQPLG